MHPFTIVLIVAAVLVVAYAVWSFVRPRRGTHIPQNAPMDSEPANTARIISKMTNQGGGNVGGFGGGGGSF